MESSRPPAKAIVGLVVVVLLVIASTAAVIATNSSTNKDLSNPSATTSSSSADSTTNASSGSTGATNFKDGTYTASANYDTPGGIQTITVKLTVSGNTVTDSSLTQNATEREDEEFQSRFESAYLSDVVGKKLSDVSLSRVAGASLTTNGFNNAIADIEKQANV